MSDTPRTDDQIGYDGSTMTLIRIEFAKQLERELNAVTKERDAANARIKRLEAAGDAILNANNDDEQYEAMKQWRKAKEAKP